MRRVLVGILAVAGGAVGRRTELSVGAGSGASADLTAAAPGAGRYALARTSAMATLLKGRPAGAWRAISWKQERGYPSAGAREPSNGEFDDETYPSHLSAEAEAKAADAAQRRAKAEALREKVRRTPISVDGEAYPSYVGRGKDQQTPGAASSGARRDFFWRSQGKDEGEFDDETYPSHPSAGAEKRLAEEAKHRAKAEALRERVRRTSLSVEGEASPSAAAAAVPRSAFKQGHFGDGAVLTRPQPEASVEEVRRLTKRLDELREDVEAPWQMRFEYAEAARNIADFAPEALERYRGHSVSLDYWIMSHVYKVDSQAMATMSFAASAGKSVDDAQKAAINTWRALALPLEKLHAEEAIWIASKHIDKHEHDLPEDSMICNQTWRRLEDAVEKADWETDMARKVTRVTTRLREEVALDQEGRAFDAVAWAKVVEDMVSEICPEAAEE